ncbi:SLC13 family permease [Sabulicella rubraurantiaca]|uniref:SLC13 family permease n=1 Tax=Sabulicella rubraurantiaca TaxID=2811429 RepID=UPI001A969414|nr:SLC13 family permease [Sabulicella rubraurantiaca]
MTLPQIIVFAILAVMMALFVWDRIRYDLVALLALLASVAAGVVAPDKAFDGFGDDVVIIVASVLVVSAGIGKSRLIRRLIRVLEPQMRTPGAQVATLTGTVTLLAAMMKNIGAVAIFLPIALQVARRTGTSPSLLLMPMAYGSLVGGIVTLVGTSPNIIVSRARHEMTGEAFGMFDFTPVGLGVVLVALLFLSVGWRLLRGVGQGRTNGTAIPAPYLAEARLGADSPFAGRTVGELETEVEGEVHVAAIVREEGRRYFPAGHWRLHPGDQLVLRGDPDAMRALVAEAQLELGHTGKDGERTAATEAEAVEVEEAVVLPGSPLAGTTARALRLRDTQGVNLLAVSRRGEAVTARVRDLHLRVGDVLVVQGAAETLSASLDELGCLPLVPVATELGKRRLDYLPIGLMALAMAGVAAGLVPVAIAFFGAAVLTVALGVISLREAYEAIDLPILVLLACLIPISDAVTETGGAALLAGGLAHVAGALPAVGALGLTVVAAMALTPFLNNAATALIMAPVAAQMAEKLGLNPDPFLMAVAIGCACDFLTPIGHQCNMLVMGPGGYRFLDYPRLGLPLTLLVAATATMLIPLVWPLTG